MKLYEVRKYKGKKYLFNGDKPMLQVKQRWVKVGQTFTARLIKIEGKSVGFRSGWHELDLNNEFKINKDWRAYRLLIRCPACNQFTCK